MIDGQIDVLKITFKNNKVIQIPIFMCKDVDIVKQKNIRSVFLTNKTNYLPNNQTIILPLKWAQIINYFDRNNYDYLIQFDNEQSKLLDVKFKYKKNFTKCGFLQSDQKTGFYLNINKNNEIIRWHVNNLQDIKYFIK